MTETTTEHWRERLKTLPLSKDARRIIREEFSDQLPEDPEDRAVATLWFALERGLISARFAAKHLEITIDEVSDICCNHGHPKPFEL